MSQEQGEGQTRPRRKISAALAPPNIGTDVHGEQLTTIRESGPVRKASTEGGPVRKISTDQGPIRKISTEVGPRRISIEGQDVGRKVSMFGSVGRKTSFMNAPQNLLYNKVRLLQLSLVTRKPVFGFATR